MPLSLSPDAWRCADSQNFGVEDAEDFTSVLKPIIAGARARGVADGLEMLGVGAVLIDATGQVLHIGGRGRRMLGGWARLVNDHLVAERDCDNGCVQDLIGSVVGSARHDPEARIRVAGTTGTPGLTIRALRFETDEGTAQCLHAVLVIEDSDQAR